MGSGKINSKERFIVLRSGGEVGAKPSGWVLPRVAAKSKEKKRGPVLTLTPAGICGEKEGKSPE